MRILPSYSHVSLTKCLEENLPGNYTRILHTFLKQILEVTPNKTAIVQSVTSYFTNQPRDEQDILGTAGEARINS